MREVWPHEVLRLDLDAVLDEARQQEALDPGNLGEYELAQCIHEYLVLDVIPSVLRDDWIYEAASILATEHVPAYYQCLRVGSSEAYASQQRMQALKQEIVDFLRAHTPQALVGKTLNLTKSSDFFDLINLDDLSRQSQATARRLVTTARDYETVQLTVLLRSIRDVYEMGLPRVMFVVRRVMKAHAGATSKRSDEELLQPSDYVNWFSDHADAQHPFWPVVGDRDVRKMCRVARNVASHHIGLRWEPDTDTVVLQDKTITLTVHVRELHQRYRHLVYLCDYGLRAILAAYCEREAGPVSDALLDEYNKTFPEGFASAEEAQIRYYSR